MSDSYLSRRSELATYFDRTAAKTWERLTSDAPVSRIRETVRQGREEMAKTLLDVLPKPMTGLKVLDAGCGAGPLSIELARRGAEVLAVDISASLIKVAEERTPDHLRSKIKYVVGDMLTAAQSDVDAVVAMDSLIHYSAQDIARALERLTRTCSGPIAFTIAPKTPALSMMHMVGKAFPKGDRSPAIVPVSPKTLSKAFGDRVADRSIATRGRVARGFYISQAMEVCA